MPVDDPRLTALFKDMPEAFTKVHYQVRTTVWGRVSILNSTMAEELEPVGCGPNGFLQWVGALLMVHVLICDLSTRCSRSSIKTRIGGLYIA